MQKFRAIMVVLVLAAPALSRLILEPPVPKPPAAVVGDPGDKLILTPYIEQDDIETARTLSIVQGEPFPENLTSYSGFFTVNKEYNSNLFFWFFLAEENYEDAPVILWLQGGPGSTSLYALFMEIGPLIQQVDNVIRLNPNSWHKVASLIFLDNPVGSGFSYTDNDEGYSTNETHVGQNIYSSLVQFFTMFPELQDNEFYIAGESYGGKFVPAAGYTIYKENPTTDLPINLQGLMIGDGFTDPPSMMYYSEYAYQLGVVDRNVRDQMKEKEDSVRQNIQNEKWEEAFYDVNDVMRYFSYASELNYNNAIYELDTETDFRGNYEDLFANETIRKILHVGDAAFDDVNAFTYNYLVPEYMKSVKPWVEELLNNGVPITFYNGEFDVICAYPLILNMYYTLDFNAAEEYKTAERKTWYTQDNSTLMFYSKSAGNFTEVLVRNAGHLVPADKPVWALELLKLILERGYTSLAVLVFGMKF